MQITPPIENVTIFAGKMNMKKFKSLFLMLMAVMPLMSNASNKPEIGTMLATQSQASTQKQAGKGDLAAFDLYGNVKKVTCDNQNSGLSQVIEFDANGRLVKMYGDDFKSTYKNIKYDANGRLTSYLSGEEGYGETTQFVYGANGLLLKEVVIYEGDNEGKTTATLVRNAASRVIKKVTTGKLQLMGDSRPEPVNETVTYKYTATDANGNWTSRRVTQDGYTYTETRTIVYY